MSEPADLTKLLFGRLSWESLPLHEPILIATFAMVVLGGAAIVVALTYFKLWGPLWRD
jgi:cytochrome o ubiquinol oxidase subunit I